MSDTTANEPTGVDSTIVHPFGGDGRARRTTWGYETRTHPKLDRIQNAVSAFCGVLAGAAIVAILLLTLAELIARNVFSAPLGWSISFIELYLLPISAFFGIVAAYRSGAHVAVVSLYQAVSPPVRKGMLVFAYLMLIVGLVAIGIPGLFGVMTAVANGEGPVPGSSELAVPTALWRSVVPISTLLALVIVVIDLYRELTAPWDAPATDYDPGDGADEETPVDLGHLADADPAAEAAGETGPLDFDEAPGDAVPEASDPDEKEDRR
ncbi:MAG: TRAP transporter small permease [Gordonia sp. (in: high G+C Gram-positive bacteria)]|uniref:TRAP transporter small permease n=1 Tax=Gordonia sp. (in: high G+C Gram-positive bacteria) TaxID=84139 RepID=UPI0039E369A7